MMPLDVQMARDAMTGWSDVQRLAFAIEIVNGITDPHSAFQLARMQSLCGVVRSDLERTRMLEGVSHGS